MNFILKGNICYSENLTDVKYHENSYLICENSISKGVFSQIPEKYSSFPLTDYKNAVIIPGLCDLHIHAPQYTYRGLGMDLELLDWLNTYTFPEESKYFDLDYADKAYTNFTDDLKNSATSRACVFATIHVPATIKLMEKLEQSGLVTYVGKVNMDRNSPDILREQSAEKSFEDTKTWLANVENKFKNTYPIITPRFIPTCSDELMQKLKILQVKHNLPVQSHLSESLGEIEWVRQLAPYAGTYGAAYNNFGLFGGDAAFTIMAHCVWSKDEEEDMLKDNGVFVAHCPQSNTNICSGIAPIRRFLKKGIRVGLGTDVAGGCHTSIFRAMNDAISVSKLYWRLVDNDHVPLTVEEAFYLGTLGGGEFFGKVGSFEEGYEFDAVVIDDANITKGKDFSLEDRLARIVYLSTEQNIKSKYVRGEKVL